MIGVLSFLGRIPSWAYVAAGVALLLWLYGDHREKQGRYEGRAETIAKYEREARKVQTKLDPIPKETDRAIIKEREATRDSTEQFIARGGVRRCPTSSNASSGSAGVSEALHQEAELDAPEQLPPVVTVTPDDVRICTDNTVLAEEFRKYILRVESATGKRD